MIDKMIRWAYQKASGLEYGTVTIVLKVHEGRVAHVLREVSESLKPEPSTAGGPDEPRRER